MRQLSIIFLFVLLFISGCNFPLVQTPNAQAEISTRVALYSTQTALSISSPEATDKPAQQENSTPDILSTTPEISPTIEYTHTPTFTATTSGDPASLYGTPGWDNPLDNGSSFGLSSGSYSDDYTSIQVTNGAMILTSLTGTGWRGWRLTDRQVHNFYLEGTFQTQTCAGSDNYGLVVRAPDFDSGQGYYISLTCDGRYSFSRWDADGITYLINWTQNNQIIPGSNQINRLGIMATGSTFRIYINGVFVQEITDQYFSNDTRIGVYVAGLGSIGFSVKMDRIRMWTLQ